MIGNDIVEHCPIRVRFIERVCTHQEIHLPLWTVWAIKEAMYKALRLDAPFAPKQFEVAENPWRCRYNETVALAQVIQTEEYTHAIVQLNEGRTHSRIGPCHTDESFEVRKLAIELLDEIGLPDCYIVGRAPPEIHQNGNKLPLEISLSHDGSYVAVVIFWPAGVLLPRQSSESSRLHHR